MSKRERYVRRAIMGSMVFVLLLACGASTYIRLTVVRRPRAARLLEAAGHDVEAIVDPSIGDDLGETAETDLEIWGLGVSGGSELESLAGVARDVKHLKHLVISGGNYTNCKPIRSFSEQLETITLIESPITDVSVLKHFVNLQDIHLSAINATSIPHLKNLKKLRSLYVENVPLSDLGFIANLNLTSVSMSSTELRDLSALGTLSRLTSFSLEDNPTVDLAPIADAQSLSTIKLYRVEMADDIDWLAKCSQLRGLVIWDSPVDRFPRIENSQLETLTLRGCSLSDIQELSALVQLQSLDITGSPIRDLSPLSCLNLHMLNLGHTEVVDLRPLMDMEILYDLDITGSKVRDLTPLHGLPLAYLRVSSTVPTPQIDKFKAARPDCTVEIDWDTSQ